MKHIRVLSSSLSSKQSFPCSIYPLARQTILYFLDSITHSTAPFQLIHIDTCGPYHSSTTTCTRYFITIIDDYSRATWTHLLGAKSNAFDMLKSFIAMAETHFNTTIKIVRSDNALELGSSSTASNLFFSKRYYSSNFLPTHTSTK